MHLGKQYRLTPFLKVEGSFLHLHLFATTEKILYLPVTSSVALF